MSVTCRTLTLPPEQNHSVDSKSHLTEKSPPALCYSYSLAPSPSLSPSPSNFNSLSLSIILSLALCSSLSASHA